MTLLLLLLFSIDPFDSANIADCVYQSCLLIFCIWVFSILDTNEIRKTGFYVQLASVLLGTKLIAHFRGKYAL